jgi:hypothetical protein
MTCSVESTFCIRDRGPSMSISFVPKHEFFPADDDTLRRRLQSVLGIDTGQREHCGHGYSVDLRSGVRLVVARRYKRVLASSGLPKAVSFIHIMAMIAEDAPLHRSLFHRKDRISLGGLEHLMNAAVRTGLWKIAEYAGRLHPSDWGPDGLNYYIDFKEWNSRVASDLRCERLTVREV